jgi:hypothetical protein
MVCPFLEDVTAEQRTTCDKGIDHMAGSWSVREDLLGDSIVPWPDAQSTVKIRAAAIWHYAACSFPV